MPKSFLVKKRQKGKDYPNIEENIDEQGKLIVSVVINALVATGG